MIQHIVLFKLNNSIAGKEKRELLCSIKKEFEELPRSISVLRKLCIRRNFNPDEEYDFQLLAILESKEDLRTYALHPEHQRLVENLIKPHLEKRAAVDVWASEV